MEASRINVGVKYLKKYSIKKVEKWNSKALPLKHGLPKTTEQRSTTTRLTPVSKTTYKEAEERPPIRTKRIRANKKRTAK